MWRLVATRNQCNEIKQEGGGNYTNSWKLILPTTVKYAHSPRSRWPGSFTSKTGTILVGNNELIFGFLFFFTSFRNEQLLLGEHLS